MGKKERIEWIEGSQYSLCREIRITENVQRTTKKEMWGNKEIVRLRRICEKHVEIRPTP